MFYDAIENRHGLPNDPFKAIVAPRPIGWVSSVSQAGIANLAPYSFFNAIAESPHYVVFGSGGLKDSLRKIGNPHLRALVECFLMDDGFVRDFCHVPAGVRNHHAYVGGLLEHVVTLLDAADRVLPLYPELDRDVLLAGIFLHDIGKVRELSFERAFAYTTEGQLVGHIVIGVEMLNEKAAKVPDLTGEPFPKELLLRLKHMILSHHGTYEFGSPRLPMTPEAIALHQRGVVRPECVPLRHRHRILERAVLQIR